MLIFDFRVLRFTPNEGSHWLVLILVLVLFLSLVAWSRILAHLKNEGEYEDEWPDPIRWGEFAKLAFPQARLATALYLDTELRMFC